MNTTKTVKTFECYRCGINTKTKATLSSHLKRKNPCEEIRENIEFENCEEFMLKGYSFEEYQEHVSVEVKKISQKNQLTKQLNKNKPKIKKVAIKKNRTDFENMNISDKELLELLKYEITNNYDEIDGLNVSLLKSTERAENLYDSLEQVYHDLDSLSNKKDTDTSDIWAKLNKEDTIILLNLLMIAEKVDQGIMDYAKR